MARACAHHARSGKSLEGSPYSKITEPDPCTSSEVLPISTMASESKPTWQVANLPSLQGPGPQISRFLSQAKAANHHTHHAPACVHKRF